MAQMSELGVESLKDLAIEEDTKKKGSRQAITKTVVGKSQARKKSNCQACYDVSLA
jgi:hypothetical protein